MKKALSKLLASRTTQVALGLILGLIFLYLALREAVWADVGKLLSQVKVVYLLLGFVISAITLLLKSFRWKFLLSSCHPILGIKDISAAFISAQLLNSLFPVRIGDLSRIFVISQKGVQPACVLGTFLSEKFIDALAFIVLVGIFTLRAPLPSWLNPSVSVVISFFVLAGLLIFFSILFPAAFLKTIVWFADRLPERWSTFVQKHTKDGIGSFHFFRNPEYILRLLLVTIVIWGISILTNQLVLLALGLPARLDAALLSLILILVGYSLPALPAKVGVFEYACVLTCEYLGWNQSAGLSYGILLHGVVYFPVVILGLISFWHIQASGLKRLPIGHKTAFTSNQKAK